MQRQLRSFKPAGSSTILTLVCATVLAGVAAGEQTYVTRYDAFAGYAYLNSPKINLTAKGIHFQIGVRPSKWYSIGFDYSNVSGNLTLTPDLLPTSLQDNLGQRPATDVGGPAPGQLFAHSSNGFKNSDHDRGPAAGSTPMGADYAFYQTHDRSDP
jgi:hypothetical protein